MHHYSHRDYLETMTYNFEPQNNLLHNYTPRVAIVTGAARGIGYSTAHQLAADGIDIAVNDLPEYEDRIDIVVAEIRAVGRRAIALPADVSDENDVKTMIAVTVEELGGVDIVNNVYLYHTLVAMIYM